MHAHALVFPICLAIAGPPSHRATTAPASFQEPGETEAWTQSELERVADEIKQEIAAMRGMEFKRPVKVAVADKKAFLDYARERQKVSMSPGRVARDEHVAKLLGLIPKDMDLMAAFEDFLDDQVGGFYDPASDSFWLMDSFTGGIAKVILAHELTPALDDQHFDIDGTLKDLREETDAELAFQSVVEGSGTAAMNQWTVKHLKELSMSDLAGAPTLGGEGLVDAPPYIWKPLFAVYLRGEGFLTRSKALNFTAKAAKVSDIVAAFERPPRSTEQILHPEKYWDDAKRDEPLEVAFEGSNASDVDGWKVLGEDTLGELFLALLTTPIEKRTGVNVKNALALLAIEYTNDGAEGWGGDRLMLLEKDGVQMLDLVTAWDTPEDAREFEAAVRPILAASTPGSEIAQREDPPVVEIRVVSRGTVAEADAPKLRWRVEAAKDASRGARRGSGEEPPRRDEEPR